MGLQGQNRTNNHSSPSQYDSETPKHSLQGSRIWILIGCAYHMHIFWNPILCITGEEDGPKTK